MKQLRIVFMGTPEFSVGILKAIKNSKHQLVGIVTVADKPAGRGQKLSESAVKQYSIIENIPVLQPVSLKDSIFLDQLEAWKADVFIVVAFRMLPEAVWKLPIYGTFNLHASLLPDYRGAAPINWAIINGDKFSGLSTFLIDEKIDTGAVLFQTKMPIDLNETAGELHDRMIIAGGDLVVKTLDALAADTIQPIQQTNLKNASFRPAPKLFKENTKINWYLGVLEIHNMVRGLSPHPIAWTNVRDKNGAQKMCKIHQTKLSTESGSGWWSNKKQLFFSNDSGTIEILSLQIEGKKRMTAQEWLVGNSISDWKIG
jgi:methionyl-tRNA formyltransferase